MSNKARKKKLKLWKNAGKSRYTRRQETSRHDSRSGPKPQTPFPRDDQ